MGNLLWSGADGGDRDAPALHLCMTIVREQFYDIRFIKSFN